MRKQTKKELQAIIDSPLASPEQKAKATELLDSLKPAALGEKTAPKASDTVNVTRVYDRGKPSQTITNYVVSKEFYDELVAKCAAQRGEFYATCSIEDSIASAVGVQILYGQLALHKCETPEDREKFRQLWATRYPESKYFVKETN